jgi:7-alpha-hydroxysteroid dehydrogenase
MITDAFRLDGKFALITGASKGIGAGIATTFAEMGADVALLARSEDALTEVADAIQQLGREALCLPCDITDDSAIPRAIAALEQRFGRLDILINNAGGPGKGYGSLEQVDRERFDHTLNINLSSAYALTHHALPLLRATSPATIVNISSALAWMVDRQFAAYGAAKAGMEQMTRILAYELAPHIRVNAVAPGAIETPSTAFITQNPEMLEQTVRWIPQGRMGQPQDIALAALYLASPASSFVSGKVLEVDGGMAALPGSAIEGVLARSKTT